MMRCRSCNVNRLPAAVQCTGASLGIDSTAKIPVPRHKVLPYLVLYGLVRIQAQVQTGDTGTFVSPRWHTLHVHGGRLLGRNCHLKSCRPASGPDGTAAWPLNPQRPARLAAPPCRSPIPPERQRDREGGGGLDGRDRKSPAPLKNDATAAESQLAGVRPAGWGPRGPDRLAYSSMVLDRPPTSWKRTNLTRRTRIVNQLNASPAGAALHCAALHCSAPRCTILAILQIAAVVSRGRPPAHVALLQPPIHGPSTIHPSGHMSSHPVCANGSVQWTSWWAASTPAVLYPDGPPSHHRSKPVPRERAARWPPHMMPTCIALSPREAVFPRRCHLLIWRMRPTCYKVRVAVLVLLRTQNCPVQAAFPCHDHSLPLFHCATLAAVVICL